MSLRIDLKKTLEYAEGLYIQIKNFKNLPVNICEILGLPVAEQARDEELEAFENTLVGGDKTRRESKQLVTTASFISKVKSPNTGERSLSSSSTSSTGAGGETLNRSRLSANNVTASSAAGTSITRNLSYTFKNGEDTIEYLN